MFRNITLKCFTEIGSLVVGENYNGHFLTLFNMVMTSVQNMVPVDNGIPLYNNRFYDYI